MEPWRVFVARVWATLTSHRRDSDLEHEIEAHLEALTQEHLRAGTPQDAARAAARREFGSVEFMKEVYRQQGRYRLLDTLARDLRYGLRQLRASPLSAAVQIGSIALGVAATTAVFAFVDALVLHPLPYDGADRMIRMVVQNAQGQNRGGVALSGSEFAAFQQLAPVEDAIATATWDMTMTGRGRPVHVRAGQYSGNAFDYYRVRMARGRPLAVADAPLDGDSQPVVVLSDRLWRQRLGGRDDVIGQSIRLDGSPFTVVGVAPPAFVEMNADVYLPLRRRSDPANLYGIQARVRPGWSLAAAEAALQPWFTQLLRGTPGRFVQDVEHLRLVSLAAERREAFRGTFTLLLIASMTLLALGCANVSILLLARAVTRRQEIAVRAALGATRRRLIGQLLIETLMIALLGSGVGIVLTWWGVPSIVAWLPARYLPADVIIGVNRTVVLAASALATLIGLLVGVSPALQAATPGLWRAMRVNGRLATASVNRRRTHFGLIAAQVTLTVILLAGAGTALISLRALVGTRLNFDYARVLVATIPLPEGHHVAWEDRRLFFERIRQQVLAVPGVDTAALSFAFVCCAGPATPALMPMLNAAAGNKMEPATVHRVSPEFFATLRIPMRAGRGWTAAEEARAARVAVVAEQAAHQLWPGQDPLGQRVRMPQLKARQSWETSAPASDDWLEIIGVVADVPTTGLRQPSRWPVLYVPFALSMGDIAKLVIRTHADSTALIPTLEREIQTVDPDQPVSETETAAEILRSTGWGREEIVATVMLVVAGLGLALASVGLYSVIFYLMAQRAREVAIRRALGEGTRSLIWSAIRSTMVAVALGVVAGVVMSTTVIRWTVALAPMSPEHPWILVVAVASLLGAALVATIVPAWRASSADPLSALRGD